VARVALLEGRRKSIYYAPDLRKLVKKDERRLPLFASNDDWNMPSGVSDDTPPTRKGYNPLASLDDDEPFGWIPPNNSQ